MIEQIKQLLSEATIHIQHDVNSTEISFSFKQAEEKVYIDVSNAKEQTKKEIEKIIEATGAPKDKVIIASVPKVEPKKESKEKALTLIDVEPIDPNAKRTKERFKELEELGWKDKEDQMVCGGIGLAKTYIEKTEDVEWKRCVEQIKSDQMKSRLMEEERKEKLKRANAIVQQATAMSQGKATVIGTMSASKISDEQRELMEMAYAVPDEDPDDIGDIPLPIDDVKYKGEPATPQQAFDVPVPPVPPVPPAPPKPDTDMHLIAANPMEQMKKNSGKPYLNKAGVIIEPKKDDDVEKKKLWDSLMERCKKNDIDTEDIVYDKLTILELEEYHALIDEQESPS